MVVNWCMLQHQLSVPAHASRSTGLPSALAAQSADHRLGLAHTRSFCARTRRGKERSQPAGLTMPRDMTATGRCVGRLAIARLRLSGSSDALHTPGRRAAQARPPHRRRRLAADAVALAAALRRSPLHFLQVPARAVAPAHPLLLVGAPGRPGAAGKDHGHRPLLRHPGGHSTRRCCLWRLCLLMMRGAAIVWF